MADYTACQMTGTLNALSRTVAKVEPKIRYAMQGRAGGVLETWISEGRPDYRPSTHTDVAILARWYSWT